MMKREESFMNEKEIIAKKAFVAAMENAIRNNPFLNETQKQQAIQKLDIAAQDADFVTWVLRQCRFVF